MRSRMMTVEDFPLCCKASIIVNFPQGDQEDYTSKYSEEAVRVFVKRTLKEQYHKNEAFVVASTTDNQTIANKVLRELGFSCSKWGTKFNKLSQYTRGAKIRIWFYPLMDLPEELK